MTDDLVKNIVSMFNSMQSKMKDNLPIINSKIELIISKNNTNINEIEFLLDVLLDYNWLRVGKDEFIKLNNYYATFNPKNANIYTDFYNEN